MTDDLRPYEPTGFAWERWALDLIGSASTIPSARKAIERCVRAQLDQGTRVDEYRKERDLATLELAESALAALALQGRYDRLQERLDDLVDATVGVMSAYMADDSQALGQAINALEKAAGLTQQGGS